MKKIVLKILKWLIYLFLPYYYIGLYFNEPFSHLFLLIFHIIFAPLGIILLLIALISAILLLRNQKQNRRPLLIKLTTIPLIYTLLIGLGFPYYYRIKKDLIFTPYKPEIDKMIQQSGSEPFPDQFKTIALKLYRPQFDQESALDRNLTGCDLGFIVHFDQLLSIVVDDKKVFKTNFYSLHHLVRKIIFALNKNQMGGGMITFHFVSYIGQYYLINNYTPDQLLKLMLYLEYYHFYPKTEITFDQFVQKQFHKKLKELEQKEMIKLIATLQLFNKYPSGYRKMSLEKRQEGIEKMVKKLEKQYLIR